jgi:cystinosin
MKVIITVVKYTP